MSLPFFCSFCGKPGDEVRMLIAAPLGAFICDDCVRDAVAIVDDADRREAELARRVAEVMEFGT